MSDYLHWFFSFTDPFYIVSGMSSVKKLIFSSKILFWILAYTVLRYHLPIFLVWIAYAVRPKAFDPPAPHIYAGVEPLISVLIAGRNPGEKIVRTIRSVLESEYRNLEVIFADDHSTDDSVALARALERVDRRVRVFANANHSGKPANLNFGLMFARGQFIFVLDADSQVYPDTMHRMLPYFEDPTVAAVSPSILVRNPHESFITRFQQIEYALTFTLVQIWRSYTNLMTILPGMGTMFRATALKGLGGYDMGLGDDTDLTLRLRKARWRLKFSLKARISTDVPVSLGHLMRQRSRWTRNMVKMRLRKHRDMGSFRYGWVNALLFYENVLNRTVHPLVIVGLSLYAHVFHAAASPVLIGGLYWYTTFALYAKCLIARDLTGVPASAQFLMAPFYALYRVPLLLNQVIQVPRELLHIKTWHPYVPRRIWDAIPHH